jgi:serine/threonine-protein kinase TTK/MPS1
MALAVASTASLIGDKENLPPDLAVATKLPDLPSLKERVQKLQPKKSAGQSRKRVVFAEFAPSPSSSSSSGEQNNSENRGTVLHAPVKPIIISRNGISSDGYSSSATFSNRSLSRHKPLFLGRRLGAPLRVQVQQAQEEDDDDDEGECLPVHSPAHAEGAPAAVAAPNSAQHEDSSLGSSSQPAQESANETAGSEAPVPVASVLTIADAGGEAGASLLLPSSPVVEMLAPAARLPPALGSTSAGGWPLPGAPPPAGPVTGLTTATAAASDTASNASSASTLSAAGSHLGIATASASASSSSSSISGGGGGAGSTGATAGEEEAGRGTGARAGRRERRGGGTGGSEAEAARRADALARVRELGGLSNEVVVGGMRYVRAAPLGRGGFSQVWSAIGPDLRLYALKDVRPAEELLDQPEAVQEARRAALEEVQRLQALRGCEQVVQLLAWQEHPLGCYLVLELAEIDMHRYLQRLFRRYPRFQDRENAIRHHWQQMLEAVHAVHQAGIVHADLKPANFVLCQGQVKLIDFGIARQLGQESTHVLVHQAVGTPSYMPPEAFPDASDPAAPVRLGRAADVWSLGVILYYMTFQRTPFHSIQDERLRVQKICDPNCPIPVPHPLPNPHLIPTIVRCLNRNPALRPSIPELLAGPFLCPQ